MPKKKGILAILLAVFLVMVLVVPTAFGEAVEGDFEEDVEFVETVEEEFEDPEGEDVVGEGEEEEFDGEEVVGGEEDEGEEEEEEAGLVRAGFGLAGMAADEDDEDENADDQPPYRSGNGVDARYYKGNPNTTGWFKIENPSSQTYNEGDFGVTITLGEKGKFNWEATSFPVLEVIVKGGNGANIYDYGSEGEFEDTGLSTPLNKGGKQADISYIAFLYDPTPPTPKGAKLEVEVGAEGFFTKEFEYDWTLRKSVDLEELELAEGESADLTYTLTATRSRTSLLPNLGTGAKISVSVINTGDVATEGLVVERKIQARVLGRWVTVPNATRAISDPGVIQPGETAEYPDELSLYFVSTPGVQYRALVTASVENYDLDGETGPGSKEADGEFKIPTSPTTTSVNGTATLNDEFTIPGGLSVFYQDKDNIVGWELTDSETIQYTVTVTKSSESGSRLELDNVAILVSDTIQREDDATVTILSPGPTGVITIHKVIVDENGGAVNEDQIPGGLEFEVTLTGPYEYCPLEPVFYTTAMPPSRSYTIGVGYNDITGLVVGGYYMIEETGTAEGYEFYSISDECKLAWDVADRDSNDYTWVTLANQWDGTVFVPRPAISVTKTANPTSVRVNGTITYTITVTNSGNVALENVRVVDQLLGMDESIGSLARGASRTFTPTYSPTSTGTLVNTVNVSGSYGEQVVTASASATVSVTSGGGGGGGTFISSPPPVDPPVVEEFIEEEPEEEEKPPVYERPVIEEFIEEEEVEEEEKGDLPFTGGSNMLPAIMGMALLAGGAWLRRKR